MNKKIENPKTEVKETKELNDLDMLTEVLECEKNMSVNMTIALNETSNDVLYNVLFPLFKDIKNMQREIYYLAFQKGWYSLEEAPQDRVQQKVEELNKKTKELIVE